jgi:hypothetical protein
MLSRLLRRRLDGFARSFDYDVTHMKQVLAASRQAFIRLSRVQAMDKYREEVPPAPWYAAKLAATLHEDCGSCTQLVADMALRGQVPAGTIRAVIAGQDQAMDADVRLGYRFARAVLAHDPDADGLRAEVLAHWGQRGLVSLAFAITTSRMYPTLKYALGHGHACTVVRVAGQAQPAAVKTAA